MTSSALLLLFLSISGVAESRDVESRVRRETLYPPPIVYPFGGTFKLVVGIAVPVKLSGRILVYGQNLQFQYAVPPNATIFTNYLNDASPSRRRRSTAAEERTIVYGLLQDELNRRKIDGPDCLKKSICEVAGSSIEEQGLVGELLHVLLTPDHGGRSSADREYLLAAEAGRSHRNCSAIYHLCAPGQGLLERVSEEVT